MGKKYIDSKNNVYFVKSGIGGNEYKAFHQALTDYGSGIRNKSCRSLSWRTTKEQAQEELDEYAKKKGLKEFKE